MDRLMLSDAHWDAIAELIPGKATDRGVTARDSRLFIEAVLHVARTGVPWRDLPKEFGNWNNVYKRFSRWCEQGVWSRVFERLSENGDFKAVMLDSTIVRAHQHASGAQKKRVIKQLAALAEA